MQAATLHVPSASHGLPYRLYVPDCSQKKCPLIVFLHSIGGCGDDNYAQLEPGLDVLLSERVQTIQPTVVVAPQSPKQDPWVLRGNSPPYRSMELTKLRESESNRLVLDLVSDLSKRLPIDEQRIYLIGFSLGAAGTWDLLMRHPGRFAAGVAIAGASDTTRAALLADTAIWAFHGELDDVVPTEDDRRMAAALQAAGVRARYTEFKGVGHGSIGPALEEPELFPWLFAQQRHSSAAAP